MVKKLSKVEYLKFEESFSENEIVNTLLKHSSDAKYVTLVGRKDTNKLMETIEKLKSLQRLKIERCRGTDGVGSNQIDGNLLADIISLPNFRSIEIKKSKLDNALGVMKSISEKRMKDVIIENSIPLNSSIHLSYYINEICRNSQSTLSCLSIQSNINDDEPPSLKLLSRCKILKILRLDLPNVQWTVEEFQYLCKLENLVNFALPGSMLPSAGLEKLFSRTAVWKLREIDLEDCTNIHTDLLETITTHCPNLEKLSMDCNSVEPLDPSILLKITSRCPNLKYLSLPQMNGVGATVLKRLLGGLPNLEYFNIDIMYPPGKIKSKQQIEKLLINPLKKALPNFYISYEYWGMDVIIK